MQHVEQVIGVYIEQAKGELRIFGRMPKTQVENVMKKDRAGATSNIPDDRNRV